jgi:hypothetical protein
MKTTVRPSGRSGWSGRFVIIAMSVAFCAPAFAGSDNTVSQPSKMQVAEKATRKLCYVQLGLGLPVLCDRFAGSVPTTSSPIEIIGRMPH